MEKNRKYIKMNSDEIIVNVIGRCGSGKTTIQNIIAKALNEHGFNITVNSIDGDPLFTKEDIKDRINAIVNKNKLVTINEVQVINFDIKK